jgi:ABC-type multidrug transport system fused ATPase/permease subunit
MFWTGTLAELPRNIFRYVLATSAPHQLGLVVLTVAIFLLEVAPLELQRRIVDDLVKHRDFWSIGVLCAVYAGAVIVQGGIKLFVNVYRSWVGERATRDLRRRVDALASSPTAASSTPEAEGIQASMIVSEVEAIGGFVGGSVAEPLLQGGILCSVLAYMVHVDLWMAASTFLLFVPQLFFVPLMQGAINRRTRARVKIIRQLSVSVVEGPRDRDEARDKNDAEHIQQVFELNMGIYRFKFSMNFLMNLSTQLQVIAALLVGGWAVYATRLEIGGVVAFISGIGRLTDPWGDLVNYFRDANITQVKYALVRDAINQQVPDPSVTERAPQGPPSDPTRDEAAPWASAERSAERSAKFSSTMPRTP